MVILAGYRNLQNIDYSSCLAFCRQDQNCTSVIYSELRPPFTSSFCRFFNAKYTNLTLVDETVFDPPRQSYLIILKSRNNLSYYSNAALQGAPYSKFKTDQDGCDVTCSQSYICNAYSYALSTEKCSLYSTENIINIVLSDNSFVCLQSWKRNST